MIHFLARFLHGRKSTVVINDRKFEGNSISIEDNSVVVDGIKQDFVLSQQLPQIKVSIHGDVELVQTQSGDVNVTGAAGSISTASGDITCGDISGNVRAVSGDVHAKRISGSVHTVSGDVRA